MKIVALLILNVLPLINVFGQIDKHGNPIFISELISLDEFENFELSCNYYNIKDNISNSQSSVYIKDNPALKDYLGFSISLPSYFFIVLDGDQMKAIISPLRTIKDGKTLFFYFVMNLYRGEEMEIPCSATGEISEMRVRELEKIKPDPASKILTMTNKNLYVFDENIYTIQPYDKLKAEVVKLAKELFD